MTETVSEMFIMGVDLAVASAFISSFVTILVIMQELISTINDQNTSASRVAYVREYAPYLGCEATSTDLVYVSKYYYNREGSQIVVFMQDAGGNLYTCSPADNTNLDIKLTSLSGAVQELRIDEIPEYYTTAIIEDTINTSKATPYYNGGVVVGIMFKEK